MRKLRRLLSAFHHVNPEVVALVAILMIALTGGTISIHTVISITAFFGHKAAFAAISHLLLAVQGLVLPFIVTRNRPHIRQLYPIVLLLAGTSFALVFLVEWKLFSWEYPGIDSLRHIAVNSAEGSIAECLPRHFPILFPIAASLLISSAIECILLDTLEKKMKSSRNLQNPKKGTAP